MQSSSAIASEVDARAASRALLHQLKAGLKRDPSAIILFAAPSFDHKELLTELAQSTDAAVVGASSAGEFVNKTRGAGLACALGLAGDDVTFTAAVASGLREEPAQVA